MNTSTCPQDDPVHADGEPTGSDPPVPVLPAGGAQQEGAAGGRRGALLPEPQEGPGTCYLCVPVMTPAV